MAIADQVALEMARTAGQAPQIDVGTSALQGASAGAALKEGFQSQNKEAAAAQFQQVLNQGYQGMVQAFKSLAPEEQAMVGDPGLYQRNEDTMASWWGLVAKAKKTTEQKASLAKGTSQVLAGDKVGGNATLMTSGNIPADQGVKNIEAAQNEDKLKKQGKTIADLFQTQTAPQSKEIPGPASGPAIDGKSKLGRTVTVAAKRLEPYQSHIDAASQATGLPPALIKAVITRESGGNVKAQPKNEDGSLASSAKGLMQLIDSTATAMGVTDPYDPQQNINGGAKYLSQLITKYGDVAKGVAAYHDGPSAIDRLVSTYGDDWHSHLSQLTSDYVGDIEKYYSAYGSGNIISKEDPKAVSMQEMVQKLAAADPELPNHPLAKVLLDAMDKDAKNAKNKGSGSNINEIRAGNLRVREKAALEKRIRLVTKDINPKLDMADRFTDLDRSMPGGLFGKDDVSGVGLGSTVYRKWLMTDAAGSFRTALAALTNVDLADRSGKTVTKDELARMEKELGLGPTDTMATFRKAIQRKYNNMKGDFERDMKVDPEAALELMNRNPKLKDAFNLSPANGNQVTTKSGKKVTVIKTTVD